MIHDYIVPHVAKLVELGASTRKTKGCDYERMVSDTFRLLGFEVEYLGQGRGRNPDVVARFREDHTALIIDAKACSNQYAIGVEDRAISEYINKYTPELRKEGLTRIAFIIVSNSFKSGNQSFINEITWTSDAKRFILLTSEALLNLLAYKTKNNLPLKTIIKFLVRNGPVIGADDVMAEFDNGL